MIERELITENHVWDRDAVLNNGVKLEDIIISVRDEIEVDDWEMTVSKSK